MVLANPNDDGFSVWWQSNGQDGGGWGVYRRRFNASGAAIDAADWRVNVYTANDQSQVAVANLANGNSVAAWSSFNQGGQGVSIFARIMTPAGGAYGEFRVSAQNNPNTTLYSAQPMVAGLADGTFVVVWESFGSGGTAPTDRNISMQRFDAGGAKLGGETLVNPPSTADQRLPMITALADGGYVVAWLTPDGAVGSSADFGVAARIYEADGSQRRETFRVNDWTAGSQTQPSVTALADGGFLAMWASDGQDGSGYGTYARRFDADGNRVGEEFLVNDVTSGFQYLGSAAARADGGFVATWSTPDGSGLGIGARVFSASSAAPVVAARAVETAPGGELTGRSLIYQGHAQGIDGVQGGLQQIVAYEVRDLDDGAGSGCFTIDGVAQTAGATLSIDAADLGRLGYVASATPGGEAFELRAFDGQNWSAWSTGTVTTLQPLPLLSANAQILVNTTQTGEQHDSRVVALEGGGHVAVWRSAGQDGDGLGIYGQRFNADGSRAGGEFRVNSYTTSDQTHPVAVATRDGGFAVFWESSGEDGWGWGVFAQRYDSQGVEIGDEARVSASHTYDQRCPAVTQLEDGRFILIYSGHVDGVGTSIFGRYYDADLRQPLGGEFTIAAPPSESTQAFLPDPSITAIGGGGFVVAWHTYNGSTANLDVVTQRFDAQGAALGAETVVHAPSSQAQRIPRVAGLNDGGYAIIWQSADGAGHLDAFARVFNADGSPRGDQFQIAAANPGDQTPIDVIALANGDFLVAYASPDASDANGVYARRFTAAGAPAGDEIWLAGSSAGDQLAPRLTARPDGGFIAAFSSPDASGLGIMMRVWQGSVAPLDAVIMGSEGNDILTGAAIAERIVGLGGDDVLSGAAGADLLEGGAGTDTLDGGAGVDYLAGGSGDDVYVVDNAGDVVMEAAGEGRDTVLTGLASYVLGDNVENLTYSGSGDFSGVGNELDNIITGGSGVDSLSGGAGNDVYYVDNAGDGITELAGQGTDEARTTLASYTLGDNVENLTFVGGGAFTGTGNGLNNVITGGGGADVLNGGTGADTLIGGAGNDVYYVDNAGDTVVESAGEGVDEALTALAAYTLADNVEKLTYSGGASFSGTGNAGANTLTGGAGTDVLTGLGGNDRLDGGAGADTMTGGVGNDTYVVDNVNDVVVELAGQGADTVRTSLAAYTLGDNVENLVFTGGGNVAGVGNAANNNLTGGGGSDTLTGLEGNDTLNGGAGADTLIGGSGDDVYYVDNAGDVVAENAGEGVDTVNSSIAHTLASNVERLVLTGGGAIDGAGNDLDNALTGNGAANVLDGGNGDDTLAGGGGGDVLTGGAGLDTAVYTGRALDVVFTATAGGWTVTDPAHGAGSDALSGIEQVQFDDRMIYLDGRNNAPLIDQALNPSTDEDAGAFSADLLAGASDFDGQTLSVANFLQSDGPAAIVTRNGADFQLDPAQFGAMAEGETTTLTFSYDVSDGVSAVAQTLTLTVAGRDESMELVGTSGDDSLAGGAAADTLIGGLGGDTLTGGAGADAFRFGNAGEGMDVVTDFQSGVDRIEVSSAGFDNLPIGELSADRFSSDGMATADTRFIFEAASRVLSYDADGSGLGTAVGFATLNVSMLSNTNIFVVS